MDGMTALPRKMRGLMMGAAAALLMSAMAVGVAPHAAWAQDLGPAGQTGATAELVAAAKKEGALTFYGTAQQDSYDTVFAEFMKDYPQIKVTATRVRTANFLERVLLEFKSGDNKADVVHATSELAELEEAGAIEPYAGVDKYQAEHYRFPAPKAMPGLVTDAILVKFVDYNTSMLKPADLPKTWDDLLDPKWKGKLALDIEGYEWFAAMWKTMGPEKADVFMKALSKNVVLREGATQIMELMVAGEFPISLEAYGHRIADFQKQGAPVDVVHPIFQPITVIPSYWGAIKTAKHPNAAKLVLHWLASDRGQAAQAKAGRVPVLKTGVDHPVLKWLDDGKPATFVIEPKSIDYTEVAKQFNTYFVRAKQ
ncbi:MAG TPA: ABC transporter substrate-binding protein [Alphaproteobacteria bacterium]